MELGTEHAIQKSKLLSSLLCLISSPLFLFILSENFKEGKASLLSLNGKR